MNRKRKIIPGQDPAQDSESSLGDDAARERGFGGSTLKRSENSFIYLGAGIVTVIAFFIFFMATGKDDPAPADTSMAIHELESRIQALEDRIVQLGSEKSVPAAAQTGVPELDAYQARVERVEAALSVKFESLTKRLAWIESRLGAMSKKQDIMVSSGNAASASASAEGSRTPVKQATVSSVKKKPAAPAETSINARPTVYHVVEKGDTLYGISRKYDISLNDLLQLNNLKKTSAIHPGEKLKLSK